MLISKAALLSVLLVGCAAENQAESAAAVSGVAPADVAQAMKSCTPVLFPTDTASGTTYLLQNYVSDGTSFKYVTAGYVYAVTEKQPGRQTLRWLLLGEYSPIRSSPLYISKATDTYKSAKEFAAFAATRLSTCERGWYVKSYADTFTTAYVPSSTSTALRIPTLPAPAGRRAPDPKGQLPPACWPQPKEPHGEEIDPGTVGIRPGTPAPAPKEPGQIGLEMASPQLESNVEYWFLPWRLFCTGLDKVTLEPYANPVHEVQDAYYDEWALIVVNSSYYPGFVPNMY